MHKADRFSELDGFRGFATLIVVCFHYFFRYDTVFGHAENIPVAWARLGLYGVHFFFMISGFVIYWSLQNNTNPKTFIISRAARLFPAFYFAMPLTFIVVSMAGLPNREVGLVDFLFNFTMLQDYFYMRHVDAVYWSLSYEITFYFFITMLLFLGQVKNAHIGLLPLLLIALAFYAGLFDLPYLLAKFLMLKHIGQFVAGIIFYRMYTGTVSWLSWVVLLATAVLNYLIYPWVDATFLLSFYGLFYLAITGRMTWIRNPVFLWLGSISYSLYLLHQNLGYVIMRKVYALGGSGWLAIATAVIIMLILSTLVVKLIERPVGRWLQQYLTKKLVKPNIPNQHT